MASMLACCVVGLSLPVVMGLGWLLRPIHKQVVYGFVCHAMLVVKVFLRFP